MAVDDHGLEVLKKSGEEVTPGDKSDYYIKVGPTPGHPIEVVESLVDTPTIFNVAMATANTEYSFAFPADTRRFTLRTRGNSILKIALNSGETLTNYLTLSPGASMSEESLFYAGTIYLSASKPSETVEVLTWQ